MKMRCEQKALCSSLQDPRDGDWPHIPARIRDKWLPLLSAPAGRRFQDYHRRARLEGGRDERPPRVARIVLASVLFWAGACLLIFPLIHVPFFVTSFAILASESMPLARSLDRGEASVRESWARLSIGLGLSQGTNKVLAVAFSLVCLVLAGYMCCGTFLR